MELTGKTEKISIRISSYFSAGLIPDNDTLSFIKSAYGLSEPDEISAFIENGDDSGALIEMLSYPPDSFRESVEELIPPEGLSSSEIKGIENILITGGKRIFILFGNRKIFLSEEDSRTFNKRFLQRLNLELPMDCFNDHDIHSDNINILTVRSFMRKKKFTSNEENYIFINDLIYNYQSVKNSSSAEFKILINASADFLNGSDRRTIDILSEKKYFYENAILESEEFSRMQKTYSMEFFMMKKIQPPLISADEARSMICIIDRMTSIVYGMIIPSIQNIILDS